jgi:hypothetical protein
MLSDAQYSGAASGYSVVMDADNSVLSASMALPGGVTATATDSLEVWSYPNVHGDSVVTTDGAGAQRQVYSYDPFGQPIDPATDLSRLYRTPELGDDRPGRSLEICLLRSLRSSVVVRWSLLV